MAETLNNITIDGIDYVIPNLSSYGYNEPKDVELNINEDQIDGTITCQFVGFDDLENGFTVCNLTNNLNDTTSKMTVIQYEQEDLFNSGETGYVQYFSLNDIELSETLSYFKQVVIRRLTDKNGNEDYQILNGHKFINLGDTWGILGNYRFGQDESGGTWNALYQFNTNGNNEILQSNPQTTQLLFDNKPRLGLNSYSSYMSSPFGQYGEETKLNLESRLLQLGWNLYHSAPAPLYQGLSSTIGSNLQIDSDSNLLLKFGDVAIVEAINVSTCLRNYYNNTGYNILRSGRDTNDKAFYTELLMNNRAIFQTGYGDLTSTPPINPSYESGITNENSYLQMFYPNGRKMLFYGPHTRIDTQPTPMTEFFYPNGNIAFEYGGSPDSIYYDPSKLSLHFANGDEAVTCIKEYDLPSNGRFRVKIAGEDAFIKPSSTIELESSGVYINTSSTTGDINIGSYKGNVNIGSVNNNNNLTVNSNIDFNELLDQTGIKSEYNKIKYSTSYLTTQKVLHSEGFNTTSYMGNIIINNNSGITYDTLLNFEVSVKYVGEDNKHYCYNITNYCYYEEGDLRLDWSHCQSLSATNQPVTIYATFELKTDLI